MPDTSEVVVVGAGVIGCAIAYYLAREGVTVRLLEMESIGSGASAHATGSLSLLGAEYADGPSFDLGVAAYNMFADLVPDLQHLTGIDLLWQRAPSLRLALDEEEEQTIKEPLEWQRKHLTVDWINGEEVHRIEPRLNPDIIGAAYQEESTQLDSYRLTLALGGAAEVLGTTIQQRAVSGLLTQGDRVIGVRTSSSDLYCDAVVLAMGAWSDECSLWLNFPVPVRPLKGERLLLRYPGAPLPVLISSPKRGHMISRLDGLLSVGSTGGRDYDDRDLFLGVEFDRQPTESARLDLLQRAIDVFPAVEDAQLVQQLAGSRPLSPDRMPIIGPVPGWEGVTLATGHTTKGIHLATVTGRVIADYIVRGKTEVPVNMQAFLPDRFAGHPLPDFQASGLDVEE